MSNKLIERCRLCFSNNNLMSMLSGKSRKIRDSLRKMIEETVYIQIEPDDHMPLVCFNCLVDISNFYFFRLHCRENEKKLKESESGHQQNKLKKMKLCIVSLKDIEKPGLDLTEEALNWLLSKRAGLLEPQEQPKTFAAKDSQTYQETCEAFSQCEAVVTASQECQTSEVKVAALKSTKKRSKSSQTESLEHIMNKMKRKTKNSYSQTNNNLHLTSHLFVNNIDPIISTKTCGSQTEIPEVTESDPHCELISTRSGHRNQSNIRNKVKIKTKNSSQTNDNQPFTSHLFGNSIDSSISTQTCGSQTEIPEVTDRGSQYRLKAINRYSQTSNNVCLTSHLFLNYIDSSISIQDCSSQTDIPEVTEKDSQCDLILTRSGHINQLAPNKSKDVCKKRVKIPDHHAVDGALKNGFDYNFDEIHCKTEIPNVVSVITQDDFLYETDIDCNKNSSRVGTKLNPRKKRSPLNKNSNKVDPEFNSKEQLLPINNKSNKVNPQLSPVKGQLSPLECFTAPSTPTTGTCSPQSSDLLQIKSKSMFVEICKICDKILYNKREIANHNKTHMQCNICKKKFKRIRAAQIHVSTCKMNKYHPSLYVDLTKDCNDTASSPTNRQFS